MKYKILSQQKKQFRRLCGLLILTKIEEKIEGFLLITKSLKIKNKLSHWSVGRKFSVQLKLPETKSRLNSRHEILKLVDFNNCFSAQLAVIISSKKEVILSIAFFAGYFMSNSIKMVLNH